MFYILPDWLLYAGIIMLVLIVLRDGIFTKFRPFQALFALLILIYLVVNYLETSYFRESMQYWSNLK